MKTTPPYHRCVSITWVLCICMVLAWLTASDLAASTFRKAQTYQLTNLETIDDDLYVWANRFQMQGIVNGDLSSFSYITNTGGAVTQSANIFGRDITHSGRVDGAYRAFGQTVRMEGYVGRSALVFAQEATFASGSVIERDLNVFAGNLFMEGAIKGSATIRADRVEISGVIAGDVTIEADKISIIKPATILGKLTYTSQNEALIELDSGVTVAGGTTWNLPKEEKKEETDKGYTSLVLQISSLFAAFLFGIIVVSLFRPYAEESFVQIKTRFSVAIAAGLLGIVLLVLCILVLIFALITMVAGLIIVNSEAAPLGALILIFALLTLPITGFLSVAGAVIFYTGKIVVGFLVGYLIVGRVRENTGPLSKASLFVGLVILYLLFALPYFGVVLYILFSVVGAGAIMLGIKHCRKAGMAPSGPAMPDEPPLPTPPPAIPPASGVA